MLILSEVTLLVSIFIKVLKRISRINLVKDGDLFNDLSSITFDLNLPTIPDPFMTIPWYCLGSGNYQFNISIQLFPLKLLFKEAYFDSRDVPVGTGFFAEVRYGDDYDTGIYSESTPIKARETVEIRIPCWLN